jgi:hypothetical protein
MAMRLVEPQPMGSWSGEIHDALALDFEIYCANTSW